MMVLVLASFAYAGGGGQQQPQAASSDGTPQYGGTLTMRMDWMREGNTNWDTMDPSGYASSTWVNPFKEWLVIGDLEKYGPRGNNAYSFGFQEFTPEEFLKGALAKSWEWKDANTLIFYIRDDEGVMWYGNDRIGMKPRPFTADDAFFSLQRYINSPYGNNGKPNTGRTPFIDSIERGPGNQVIIRTNSY